MGERTAAAGARVDAAVERKLKKIDETVDRKVLADIAVLAAWLGGTPEHVIAEGRLPVPGNHELGTINELGASREGLTKIGAIEYCFEQISALEAGTGQIRFAEFCSPEIGTAKISPRKIEPAQIETSQTGPR